jgi:hypothetical protein
MDGEKSRENAPEDFVLQPYIVFLYGEATVISNNSTITDKFDCGMPCKRPYLPSIMRHILTVSWESRISLL